MAQSPSHKFGQIVGNLLEDILTPVLQKFCHERGLYLDIKGPRPGVRKGRKVTWQDKYGNLHDLDFVIEKDGSPGKRGRPVAFIEAAWRRYTKHSRNKAQEIQGAILLRKDHPALLRTPRQHDRWDMGQQALCTNHRVRVEGYQDEAKTCHGLARAMRRGLDSRRFQPWLTDTADDLKGRAAALARLLASWLALRRPEIWGLFIVIWMPKNAAPA